MRALKRERETHDAFMSSHSSSERTVTQLVKLRWNCSMKRRGRHTSKTSMPLTKPLVHRLTKPLVELLVEQTREAYVKTLYATN